MVLCDARATEGHDSTALCITTGLVLETECCFEPYVAKLGLPMRHWTNSNRNDPTDWSTAARLLSVGLLLLQDPTRDHRSKSHHLHSGRCVGRDGRTHVTPYGAADGKQHDQPW